MPGGKAHIGLSLGASPWICHGYAQDLVATESWSILRQNATGVEPER